MENIESITLSLGKDHTPTHALALNLPVYMCIISIQTLAVVNLPCVFGNRVMTCACELFCVFVVCIYNTVVLLNL